jgi:hypothetical protein
MGLSIGPTNLAIHTSVSGLGGLIGQVNERFELVQALGTKDELRVPVGHGTYIEVVGVAPTNPVYQVLLCQSFHHITGGMVHPLMGRFIYHVNLWNGRDTKVVTTLEGMPANSHGSCWQENKGGGQVTFSTHLDRVGYGKDTCPNPSVRDK